MSKQLGDDGFETQLSGMLSTLLSKGDLEAGTDDSEENLEE